MIERYRDLGISFEPTVKLEQLPVAGAVAPGAYMARSAFLLVDVIAQDTKTGRVTIEFNQLDSENKAVDTISAELFNQLFAQLPPMTLGKQA